jgi:GH24 family phage-related lysozyme (muramidase)
MNELTKDQWERSMSTGFGDPDHPVNTDVKHHVGKLKVQLENAEMAMSDVTKIIKYSQKLQTMFSVNEDLEDWVKAKLNHACDYVATVRDYLKFYNDEKELSSDHSQINEKWSSHYKKSINCSNPKGFSQKAHCRARKLRQSGQHTKSKPVKESYMEAILELVREQNSAMAMGALKQLNNDAKELATMLKPEMQLEDWVKAKLNLAGEYLDDVYHHLDHFGPGGRKLDESTDIEEGWKDIAAAGLLGLATLKGADAQAAKIAPKKPTVVKQVVQTKPSDSKQTVTQSKVELDQSFVDYIKSVENAGKTGYDKNKKLWFPHKSFEGGSDTIGYGHKIQKGEDFTKGITDSQAEALLKKDLEKAKEQVNKELGGRQISKKQMEMFIDFVFNMGTLKKFPKFTLAALKNDSDGMKSQYKRFASGKELKGRNTAFMKRFLSEDLNELDYEGAVGIHELMMFYAKATQDQCDQLEDCMKDQNVSCVKNLITKVTGMTMDKIQEGFYAGSKNVWISPSGKMIDLEKEKFPLNDHATWSVVNVLSESDPGYAEAKGKPVQWVYDKYSGQTSVYSTMVEYGYIRCILMTTSRKVYLDFADHTDEWRKYFSKSQASAVIKYAIEKEYTVVVDNIEKVLYQPPAPEDI